MREILFRGKTTDNEWIYGSFIIQNGEYLNNGEYTGDEYIILGRQGQCDYVLPETVGQYTGLTDKNGKKIFEGDIVLDKYQCEKSGLVGVVKYIAERSQFESVLKEHPDYVCNLGSRINSIKVIGNIHDNPELLKEREQK